MVISDGLSARAVEENVPDLYPMLLDGFASAGITTCRPVIVRYGRVAVGDQIGHLAGAKIALNLIGERPGLSCASGLSAYITYNPQSSNDNQLGSHSRLQHSCRRHASRGSRRLHR